MAYLTKPLEIGSLNLKNRLVMPPMATSKAESDGAMSQAVLDYYNEKTAGGYISLVIIEHSYISLDGKASENQLSVSEDRFVEGLSKLSRLIHENGCKTIMQINHAGSAASMAVTGSVPMAPSAIVHPRKADSGDKPREMNKENISNVVKAFQNAARRVKEAGFDGVELHSAHGYLLNQFLSPITNQRTDEYGGDIDNRIRIHLEVIKAVKEAVGNDFPVFLRLGASDFRDDGTTLDDSKTASQAFEQAGVNVIDLSGGLSGYNIPGLTGQGFFSPLSQGIKSVVGIPVILTGGITDPKAADDLIAEGKADLVGVGRAILKDSSWPKQAIESLGK